MKGPVVALLLAAGLAACSGQNASFTQIVSSTIAQPQFCTSPCRNCSSQNSGLANTVSQP